MIELHQHTGLRPKITVLLDSSNEGVKKQFHCPVCGYVAFEYYGELRGLVPGAQIEEKTGARTVITCRGKCRKFALDEEGELIPETKVTQNNPETPVFVPCKAQFSI